MVIFGFIIRRKKRKDADSSDEESSPPSIHVLTEAVPGLRASPENVVRSFSADDDDDDYDDYSYAGAEGGPLGWGGEEGELGSQVPIPMGSPGYVMASVMASRLVREAGDGQEGDEGYEGVDVGALEIGGETARRVGEGGEPTRMTELMGILPPQKDDDDGR